MQKKDLPIKLDIHSILPFLPHRYPILLVDRVIELEKNKRICALKNVTINEPFFVGHFPQNPIMPGILILEALAQTAALLVFTDEYNKLQNSSNTIYYYVGIDSARFKHIVIPGDQLILNVKLERSMCNFFKFTASASVNNTIVTKARLIGAIKNLS